MKNLISNTSFGKLLLTKHLSDKQVRDLRDNYDEFLSLLLEIWMFVPCKLIDVVWVVLEIPNPNKVDYLYYMKEYEQAKERCLFEGFEVVKDKYKSCKREFIYLPNTETQVWRKITFHTGEIQTFFFDYYEQFRTIEDLVKYNLQLTPTTIKQLAV